jgi:hypothetical protein
MPTEPPPTTTHVIVQREGDRKTAPMILAVTHGFVLEPGEFDHEERLRQAFAAAAAAYRLSDEFEVGADLRWADVVNHGPGFDALLRQQGILKLEFIANAEAVLEWDDDI